MKKKLEGFTLVELLVVIVIIAIIMVLAIPGIMNISKRMKQKGLENKFESLEQAAVVFAQENSNKIKDSLGGECNENSDICVCEAYTDKITGVTTKDCHYQFKMTVEDLVVNNYYKPEKNSDSCLVVDPTNNACLDCVVLTVQIDDDHRNALGIIDRKNYYLEDATLVSVNTLGYEKLGTSYRCKDGKGPNPSYPGGEKGETPSTPSPSEPDKPTEPVTPSEPGSTVDNVMGRNFYKNKDAITKIVFENSISSKSGATDTFDVSENNDRGVMAHLVPTSEDNTKYTLYIQANGKVIAPEQSLMLFSHFTNLVSIEGFENFDTKNATNMNGMFYDCPALISLDLSSFDTGKVTDMRALFGKCTHLTSINFGSNFNTSNVTDMAYMFEGCKSLKTLNLKSFNTSNVTDMTDMFRGCSSFTSLDLSSFNTTNVTDMSTMFYDCSALTSLNLSSFDIRNVTDMTSMFYNCPSLANLDISKFDIPPLSTSNSNNIIFINIPCTVKIIVKNSTIKNWVIEKSHPKLIDSNITIKA